MPLSATHKKGPESLTLACKMVKTPSSLTWNLRSSKSETSCSNLCHEMVGCGEPVASQVRTTMSPGVAVTEDWLCPMLADDVPRSRDNGEEI